MTYISERSHMRARLDVDPIALRTLFGAALASTPWSQQEVVRYSSCFLLHECRSGDGPSIGIWTCNTDQHT